MEDAASPTPLERIKSSTVPDGGYGWVIVGCMLCINAVTWGVNTTYGVYSAYYLQHNYFAGGSTLRYAWVGGLCVAVSLSSGPLANYLVGKFGFRTPFLIGAVCVCVGQCCAGIAPNYGVFLVCQGLIFGLGLGLTMIVAQPLLAHWFDRRLALAQGIANAGSGVGALILSNTTRVVLQRIDVKWSLVINGLISISVLLPAAFLLRARDQHVGMRSHPLKISYLWHPGYMWVCLWGAFSIMAYFVAIYSLASFATSGLGLTQTQGAALQSILAAGQAIGRPCVGWALDKGGRINMTLSAYLITGLSCLVIWLPAKSFGVLILFALVQGLVGGTLWSAATPLTAKIVGVKELRSALGILWLALVIPSLVAQPIAIALLDHSERVLGRKGPEAYYISIGFCGGMGIASALLLYPAKRWIQGDWKVLKVA
ncbi:UM00103-like protein [Kockovaella imperatae]|uniref:UM00103-like protein n=1 Tax=Kockovaella imperatae TaxID=4999 RepID=A0A1Y1UQR7_9TREE|nr:UM00103-like protein [Kockovaella imperatae]ORX40302.1 UM00103-like protein [Kockovaella imperatae]